MLRVIFLLIIAFSPLALVQAEIVEPWEPGQDLDSFYGRYCAAQNLDTYYFPSLPESQREALIKLISEVFWIDFSDYLLDIKGSSAKAVVESLQRLNQRIPPGVKAVAEEASHDPMRSKYVYLHNRNLKQRNNILDRFNVLTMDNPQLAGAMITYLDCRTIRNVRILDPLIAKRINQVKSLRLNMSPDRSTKASAAEPNSDPDCTCGGGNFCYGPRGGHYCITLGGKTRYVKH